MNISNRIPQYKSVSWLLLAQTTAKYSQYQSRHTQQYGENLEWHDVTGNHK